MARRSKSRLTCLAKVSFAIEGQPPTSSDLPYDLPFSLGPNVIRPPEPIFQQSTMARRAPSPVSEDGSKRKKLAKFEPENLETARPEFGRNRCTVRMTQGDPDSALERAGTSLRSYVVLSDLSEEAGYALQWAIGQSKVTVGT